MIAILSNESKIPQRWNKQTIISAFQEFFRVEARSPKLSDLSKRSWLPASSTIIRIFGSFNEALEASGLSVNRKFDANNRWDRELIIVAYRNFFIIEGRPPKIEELGSKNNLPSKSSVLGVFKYHSNAIKEAGLPNYGGMGRGRKSCWNEITIISAIQSFIKKNGRNPKSIEFGPKNKLPGYSTLRRYFAGLKQALIMANDL